MRLALLDCLFRFQFDAFCWLPIVFVCHQTGASGPFVAAYLEPIVPLSASPPQCHLFPPCESRSKFSVEPQGIEHSAQKRDTGGPIPLDLQFASVLGETRSTAAASVSIRKRNDCTEPIWAGSRPESGMCLLIFVHALNPLYLPFPGAVPPAG